MDGCCHDLEWSTDSEVNWIELNMHGMTVEDDKDYQSGWCVVPVEIQMGYISFINWKHYCLSQHSHSVDVNWHQCHTDGTILLYSWWGQRVFFSDIKEPYFGTSCKLLVSLISLTLFWAITACVVSLLVLN